jgi:hypothetical protein
MEVTRVGMASVFSVAGGERLKYSLQPLVEYTVTFSLVEYWLEFALARL